VYFNYGIAIHGARNVPLQPASHGCIRIPLSISENLQDIVGMGDQVYVWDGVKEPEHYGQQPPTFNWIDPDYETTTTTDSTTTTLTESTTTEAPATTQAPPVTSQAHHLATAGDHLAAAGHHLATAGDHLATAGHHHDRRTRVDHHHRRPRRRLSRAAAVGSRR
jgi:hypothetical protein